MQARDLPEVTTVPHDKHEPVFERCRRDESISDSGFRLTPYTSRTLGHAASVREFPERRKKYTEGSLVEARSRKQLAPRYYRVGDLITSDSHAVSTPEMVDENIGVDKNLSHAPIPHVKERKERA